MASRIPGQCKFCSSFCLVRWISWYPERGTSWASHLLQDALSTGCSLIPPLHQLSRSHRAMLWNYSLRSQAGLWSSMPPLFEHTVSRARSLQSFDLPGSYLRAFSSPFLTMRFPQQVCPGGAAEEARGPYTPTLQSENKLHPAWDGPFKVIKQLNEVNYVVKLSN
ncbi:uncharacterized protein LOC117877966 isoform X2 [Trachemys scripta elegans]|nr:uncharacterized protein LOC117877966 isoform X2 [Trachemys scripta elegans]XP_034627593.1 uncharacterized protein LOC117877966 isoform X2 [Trachemys scripta elegans]